MKMSLKRRMFAPHLFRSSVTNIGNNTHDVDIAHVGVAEIRTPTWASRSGPAFTGASSRRRLMHGLDGDIRNRDIAQ